MSEDNETRIREFIDRVLTAGEIDATGVVYDDPALLPALFEAIFAQPGRPIIAGTVNPLRGDLFLFHPQYNCLAFPKVFPRVRLYQALNRMRSTTKRRHGGLALTFRPTANAWFTRHTWDGRGTSFGSCQPMVATRFPSRMASTTIPIRDGRQTV